MKTRLLDLLKKKPTFSICCVCKRQLRYRLDSPCSHRNRHLLYSHGYCEDCSKEMRKGVKKAYKGGKNVNK